jgi:signal transduction histidine kinase
MRVERDIAQKTARRLREANERMNEFLSIVGHVIREPLTLLKGRVQLAMRRCTGVRTLTPASSSASAAPPGGAGAAGVAGDACRAELASRSALPLRGRSARRGPGTGWRTHHSACAMRSDRLMRDVIDRRRVVWTKHTFTLASETEAEALVVSVDPQRIEQFVTNYLSDAFKYSPPNRPVHVRIEAAEGQARSSVRDSGPGLPTAEQQRIWERFHRAQGIVHRPAKRSREGVGAWPVRQPNTDRIDGLCLARQRHHACRRARRCRPRPVGPPSRGPPKSCRLS